MQPHLHFPAFHLTFSTISPRVLHHFTLRFAAVYLAFCSSLPCVLLQNARLNAAKHPSFSYKTPIVRPILHFHATELQLSCTYNPLHLL